MFSTFLNEISGYFDRRFLLSAFFPVVAFSGLSLGMGLALWGPNAIVNFWQGQPEELRILATVGVLGFILFIAYLFNIFQTGLTRLYEGYWDGLPILSWLGKGRRGFYQKMWDYLQDNTERLTGMITSLEINIPDVETPDQRKERKRKIDQLYSELGRFERELFLFYPPGKLHVMPTQLGNVLRTSEFYSIKRYGLDAVVAWPRLQSLLPKDFAESLRDAKANLDLLLVVTTLAGIFAIGWEVVIGVFTDRWDLFLLASLAWILALLGYSGAVQAARSYGELIKAAFDLYRWELLKAMHLKMPASYEDERKLWEEVSELLYRNYPPNVKVFRYDVETETSPIPHSKVTFLSRLTDWLGLTNKPAKKE